MTLPLDFDAVDCCGDEKALNAGVGMADAVSAKPAHSRRSRRVMDGGSKVFDLLDLDFIQLAF